MLEMFLMTNAQRGERRTRITHSRRFKLNNVKFIEHIIHNFMLKYSLQVYNPSTETFLSISSRIVKNLQLV